MSCRIRRKRSWKLSEVRQEAEPKQTDHKSGNKNAIENGDCTLFLKRRHELGS